MIKYFYSGKENEVGRLTRLTVVSLGKKESVALCRIFDLKFYKNSYLNNLFYI